MTEKLKSKRKKRSFKAIMEFSYLLIILIMIIPTIYSVSVSNYHTSQYDKIITNIGKANTINQIAKVELPEQLWDIVCGKKDFYSSNPFEKIEFIFSGLEEMKKDSSGSENIKKLEVALRACSTLKRNVELFESGLQKKNSVADNESMLDEIRSITVLFSDIMQDYILSEIELANKTNEGIKKSSVTLSLLQVVIIIFSLGISFNGYHGVSKGIRKPLEEMQKLSKEISGGNLNARTELPEVEELTSLAVNMNLMAEKIDELIKKNIQEQKSFQKAEMKALQAQITPHFLYNTFDTILWLAEEERAEDVISITKAFSQFMRISLSKGHEWITIGQEVEHIKNYLTIQKIRYADILNYDIQMNEELKDFKIIKLVLQPLVENAIYHGIKNKRGRGYLKVTVDFTDENKSDIIFTVSDNGAGFTKERLEEVKREMETESCDSEQLSSVYGVYNVNKKLKLYYGEKTSGLNIKSESSKGCTVTFTVPCLSKETES